MEKKNDELQKMFLEMDESMNVEELMEVKGGNKPIECKIFTSAVKCTGSGGITCSPGPAI